MAESEMKRFDGLEQYYKPIETCEKWTNRLFWVLAVLSVIVLYSQWIPWDAVRDIPAILFSVGVVLQLLLSLYNRFLLIPKAETKRRKQLLSDSFNIPLTPERTQAYYNNPLAPSIQRLGANVLENSFFTKSICEKMAVEERIKVFVYFIFWLIAIYWRSTPLDMLIIVTQTIFSREIIAKLVCLEVLRNKNEDIYEELYNAFLNKINFQGSRGSTCILAAFANYEATKAGATLKLSTKVFNELNPRLTYEWAEICKHLGMSGGDPDKVDVT